MADYLQFREVDLHDGRKTRIWAILNKAGDKCLGRIGWYAPWRRYTYVYKAIEAGDQVILDADCMEEITHFCRRETFRHKHRGEAIDHIDGNPCNNDPSNLRIVTIKEN